MEHHYTQDNTERCYYLENQIMAAVSQGEKEKAQRLAKELAACGFENFEVLNVLLRKAAESGGALPATLEQIFSYYQREYRTKGQSAPLLQSMVESYCKATDWRISNSYAPPVRSAISYIQLNLAQTLNLRTIAKALNISPSYLSTLFRKETGTTLTAYIHKARIAYAMDLLRDTNMQVQAVSLECGFVDVHYFSRLFRRIEGISPQGYRQRHKRKSVDQP